MCECVCVFVCACVYIYVCVCNDDVGHSSTLNKSNSLTCDTYIVDKCLAIDRLLVRRQCSVRTISIDLRQTALSDGGQCRQHF